jgi:hypothetical protein
MAEDEETRRDTRRAQLLAAMQPQSGQAVEQQRQQVQQARDLSQMRPVVQRTVGEQEKMASQVITATWTLFNDAIQKSDDPSLRRAVKESSLQNLMG